jgi:hypothetical protein
MPALDHIANAPILHLTQGPFQGQPAIYWQAQQPPDGFTSLGRSAPHAEGIALTTCHCTGNSCHCQRFLGGWHACRASLNREWRWRRDPQGYQADMAWLRELAQTSRQKRARERRQTLARGTLEGLSEQTWFDHWEQRLSPEIVNASRAIFRASVARLKAAGPMATASAKLEILQACIRAFNRLNVEHDLFIGDLEREAIGWHFEQLARAAGVDQPDLIDRWREW